MTLRKYATAMVLGHELQPMTGGPRLIKSAHRASFDYEPRPGFLYVRSRIISSRCNDNHDEFPAEEIRQGYRSLIGKPVFVNHNNSDHKVMRGVIIDAVLHEDKTPEGGPDTWVEGLHELDAQRFPKLAAAIISGRISRTSMGTDVGFSVCSACNNKASTPAEYCQHIPRMKGQILYRHTASGKREGEVIREICHKLSFFENSFLVEPPADPTAYVLGVDTRGLNKAAAKRGPGPGQGELFDLPPGAKKEPVPKPEKAKKPSDGFSLKDGPLSWDEIGERHPALYGDSEYHGEAARHSDGSGIGDAANMLAHDRADDPEAEGSSVHELSFHSEMVHPDHIDNASAGSSDSRVQEAERGYETNPSQVPPLVLVHRHGVYQVADGHHRAEAASRADKKVRAYVAYSPHPDEPFSDGGEAPYHSAEPHPGRRRGRTGSLRTLAQVTALHQGEPFQIRTKGGKWLVVDGKGKTRGEHATEADAKVHQATLYSSLPEAGDVSGNRNPKSTPDTATEIVRARMGTRTAAQQTYAPVKIQQDQGRKLDDGGSPPPPAPMEEWGGGGGGRNEFLITKHRPNYFSLTNNVDHNDNDRHTSYHYALGDAVHELAHLKNRRAFDPRELRYEGKMDAKRSKDMTPELQVHYSQWFDKNAPNHNPHPVVHEHAHDMGDEELADHWKQNHNSKQPLKGTPAKQRQMHEAWHGQMDWPSTPTSPGGHRSSEIHLCQSTRRGETCNYKSPGGHTHAPAGMSDLFSGFDTSHLDKLFEGGSGPTKLSSLATLANYQVPANCLNGGADMVKPRHVGDERAHENSPVCSDCLDGEVIDPKEKPASIFHQETDSGGRRMTRRLIKDVGQGRGRHFGPEHMMPQSYSSLPDALAYGETKAPAEVDTLRTESCPVCGETDSFDGDRCEVCHFLQPPSMFTDPDTGVAKQMDLKKEPFDQGMVGPNGEPLPDVDTQQEQQEEMAGMPGTPDDQVADLFCPACGFSADTQAPMTNNDPSMPSGQQGLMEGDLCPQCEQATLLSPNDVGEMGGEVPQEMAEDADADAVPDDQEADVDKDGIPDDGEPDIDGDGIPDDAEPDEDADGVPDDAEAAPEDPEEVPAEEDADPAAVEDEEAPQKGRKDNSRRASWRGHERNKMTKPNQTAGASSELAALKRTVSIQQEQLAVAGRQLHYLAQLAGVAGEFDAIKREGAQKIADIMNPAQPFPDPPGGAPTQTTPEAEAPETFDDPRNPGLTPGSTNGVPAQMTDSPLNPGVTLPTSPYTQLVDPTQPVAGTETHVPLDQTKIESDVHIGDPMVNKDNPQGYGFPLTGPFAADGAASANTTTSPGMQRTMASIRLAKLRKSAGLVSSDTDELLLGSQIERTAALTDGMIQHEISTLDSVVKAASRVPAGRRQQGGPLPKTAGAERRVPSLASGMDLSTQASISSGFDADDASDLFMGDLV